MAIDETYEKHRRWCNAMGKRILIIGLCVAATIFLLTGEKNPRLQGAGSDGAEAGRMSPEISKQYLRNMEYYGGKANVMAYELRMFIAGLFQGRTLAYTVGVASLVAAVGFFILAGFIPPAAGSGDGQNPPKDSG